MVPCQEEWEKPAHDSSECIAAELQLGWMGTHLCWHHTGCGAGSHLTPSMSADSNLGGTARTFRAKLGYLVLLRSLAVLEAN